MSHSPSPREEPRFRDIGAAAAAMLALFFVLLSVFVYVSRLDLIEIDGERRPAEAQDEPGTALRAVPGEGGDDAENSAAIANANDDVAANRVADAGGWARESAADAAALRRQLQRLGYQVRFPEGWRAAIVTEAAPPMSAADHDLVLEMPGSGARIAVSSWDATDLVPLVLWAPTVAEGMRPVDGRWANNAVLAGEPAMVLWAQESPISPARYAAFVGHADRYYRLAYSAADGGAALDEFAQLLNSLRWSDSPQANDGGDRLPPMPFPRPRYHPSGRLFEGGVPTD